MKPPGVDYDGIISLHYYHDPYIVPGKSFHIAVLLDSVSYTLGSYDFSITYDAAKLEIDSDIDGGVSSGREGFVTGIDVSAPGTILVNGSDTYGTGPGLDLQLLVLHFTALDPGDAELSLAVNQLSTINTDDMSHDSPVSFVVSIDSPAYYSLSGQVLDSIGGSPVADAMVELAGTSYLAATDTDGFFTIDNVLIGVYDLLAEADGKAGSKLEQVHVTGDASPVEIILPHYNYLPGVLDTPSIYVRGVLCDEEYNGIIPIDITVDQGSCPVIATEFHQSIYLKIGLSSMIYYEAVYSQDHLLSFLWNTSLYPPGEMIIKVVAYDTNNNRSEVNIPVVVIPGPGETSHSGEAPDVVPLDDYYSIIANTYGRSLDILREYPDFSIIPGPVMDSRAPEDSTIIVDFSVEKYFNGVAVYRSFTGDEGYELICQTSYTTDSLYRCRDYSPALAVDSTVYYKLAYYNHYGIGPMTDPISVRILPTYNLSLAGPSDNALVTDTSVTLSWTCEPFIENARRTDWVIASNILDATIVAYSFLIDQTEYILSDLLYNNTYEWDVKSYYEYTNSTEMANVLSRSFPRGNGAHDYSLNGAFMFTVIMPEQEK
jgi:hypothetical protein